MYSLLFTVSPYLTYYAEIWSNNYKTTLQLFILQKRAIRIIYNAGYQGHTNPLLIKLKILKLHGMIHFQTAQLMYKVKNKKLPVKIQNLFCEREGKFNFRGKHNFKIARARTTRKCFCVSVCGII